MIYLASLYSLNAKTDNLQDRITRGKRYQYTLKRLSQMINDGEFVFSPIAHCKVVADEYGLPHDYEFYKKNDRHFISKSDKVLVLKMVDECGSWEDSEGITDEIQFALDQGIKVGYLDCTDYK